LNKSKKRTKLFKNNIGEWKDNLKAFQEDLETDDYSDFVISDSDLSKLRVL